MKKTDQWSGLFLLLIAGLICWGAFLLPYGNVRNPGPGFYPLWLGILLAAMSLALLWQSTRRKEGARTLGDMLAEKVRWEKVLWVLIALVLYAALMNTLGFLIATLFLLAFLLRFIDPQPWRTVLLWTLIGSLGSYLIFEIWMKLRLPKGLLGI
jgi:hypothetical protein